MHAFATLLIYLINLYIWVLIAASLMSVLVSFNVVNTHNRFVYVVADFLYRITEPALRPIRRYVPLVSGLDLSPFVLIIALWFIELLIRDNLY